jgi:hypothetical protein
VHEVEDRRDPQPLDLRHCLVRERPVVPAGPEVHEVIGQAVPEARRAQFLHQREILTPVTVMAALLHQVAAESPTVSSRDERVRTLDAGGERKVPRPRAVLGAHPLRRRAPAPPARERPVDPPASQDVQEAFRHHAPGFFAASSFFS